MKKYNQLDGSDLLKKILILSDGEGEIQFDENTLLPSSSENEEMANAVCSMMKAYGIEPRLEDYNGIDLHENYMLCFIRDEFSEKRNKQAMALLSRYFSDDADITQMIKDSLRTRKNRYVLFKYFFLYRKKQMDLGYMYANRKMLRYMRYSTEFMLTKVITDFAYCKKIDALNRYYDKILFLLMGDYADIIWDKQTLIEEYDYPGIKLYDLPF